MTPYRPRAVADPHCPVFALHLEFPPPTPASLLVNDGFFETKVLVLGELLYQKMLISSD